MFTLHDTIELTKKIIIFAVIGAVVIFVLYLLFLFGVFLKNTFFPTPPPAAEVGFGKLPPIEFGTSEEGTFTYTINTLSGNLPKMPDRVNVYEFVEPKPEFYDVTRARAKARTAGFPGSPSNPEQYVYVFNDDTEPKRIFTINSLHDSFTISSSFLSYAPLSDGSTITDVDTAKEGATTFFQKLSSMPDTINLASTSAKALTIKDGIMSEATSTTTTRVARVDFYYRTVDRIPIRYPDYPNSIVYAIVSGSDRSTKILEASYENKEVSDVSSDYPIKTSQQAFTELGEGKGYIATYFGKENEVKINNIQLGYFMSTGPQTYLMPIYVFFGDNGFAAYVSAVQDSLIAQ